jgi:5-formyltetrahydrofolate cyclo-ligase
MTKHIMRSQYKALRDKLDRAYITHATDAIKINTISLLESVLDTQQTPWIIAGYHPIGSEVNILNILSYLSKRHNVQIALPSFDESTSTFVFRVWEPNAPLQHNKFNIPEPSAGLLVVPHIIIIPLIAFDQHFQRIGYGQGYYDQALANIKDHILKIGCAFSVQETLIIKNELHDIPLDIIVTEHQILRKV